MEQKLLAENYIKGLEIRAKAIKSELDTFYNKNKFNKNDVYLPNYVSLLNNYNLYKESIFRGFFSEGVYFADKPKYSMTILNFFSKTYYSDSLSNALNNYKSFVF